MPPFKFFERGFKEPKKDELGKNKKESVVKQASVQTTTKESYRNYNVRKTRGV